jgi:small subunit ribosomal protein S1
VVTRQNRSSHMEHEVHPMDDTWWSALLADEERYTAQEEKPRSHPAASNKSLAPTVEESRKPGGNHPSKSGGKMNWRIAQRLFLQDEVTRLQVLGANRGGLLVAGNDVHGFVPVSHLVDIPTDISMVEREKLLNAHIGQSLPLKIIECDPERGRLILSQRAALAGNGQRNVLLDQLRDGMRSRGIVTNITNFGAFVDLGGVEGLIHISELSWGRVQHPEEVVKVGDEVKTVVLSLDKNSCRVALSLKRMVPNPWETAAERYFPGLVVDAVITSVVPFGAFARVEAGLDGLIHASGMQTNSAGVMADVTLYEGQQVKVRVLHCDPKRQRLGLSLCDETEV